MEFESSIRTENPKDDLVAVSVRDDEEQAEVPVTARQFGIYFRVIYVLLLVFAILLVTVLLQPKFRNEKQSPFKTQGGFFMIMATTTFFVSVLASGILLCSSYYFQSWMTDFHFTRLKNLGFLSALLAPFWLLVFLFIPCNVNVIVFDLVVFVIFLGINVEYCYLREYVCVHQHDRTSKQSSLSTCNI